MPLLQQDCFNPTMVRLLPSLSRESEDSVGVFQSHNGAIAALRLPPRCDVAFWFQSHNGAIAACQSPRYVMLKLPFQSHNGAIAAKGLGRQQRST